LVEIVDGGAVGVVRPAEHAHQEIVIAVAVDVTERRRIVAAGGDRTVERKRLGLGPQ